MKSRETNAKKEEIRQRKASRSWAVDLAGYLPILKKNEESQSSKFVTPFLIC
jgi:hypothetical protein